MNERISEQQPPRDVGGKSIWQMVLEDMAEREQHGIAKHGLPVLAHNGRDPLIDAYQEALDLCVYLRQAIEERRGASH